MDTLNRGQSQGDRQILFYDFFKDNLELALQNNGDFIRSTVYVEAFGGDGAQVVQRMEPAESEEDNSRYSDTNFRNAEYEAVWCFPKSINSAYEVNRKDNLFAIVKNPESKILRSMALELARKESETIIDAFYKDIQVTSSDGGSDTISVAFDSNNIIAVDEFGVTEADLGITWKKLLRLQELIGEREIMEMVTMLVPAVGNTHLLEIEEIVANDGLVKSEIAGNITIQNTLGMQFLKTNLMRSRYEVRTIDTVEYKVWQLPVYTKNGMCLGVWEDMYVQVNESDIDRKGNSKLFAEKTIGSTKTDINQCFILEFGVPNA